MSLTRRGPVYPKVMGEGNSARFLIFYFSAVGRSCQVPDSRVYSTWGLARVGVLVQKVKTGTGWSSVSELSQVPADLPARTTHGPTLLKA